MRGLTLRRDVLVNVFFAGAKTLAVVVLVSAAARLFSPVQLGLFLLARRFSNAGANLVQLGAAQTLMRYSALHAADPIRKKGYVGFALGAWLVLAMIGGTAFVLVPKPLVEWVFPGAGGDARTLAVWTGLLLIATVLDFLVRSVLIAERRMMAANAIELMNGSGFLILTLTLSEHPTPIGSLRAQAFAICALCVVTITAARMVASRERWPDRSVWREIARTYAVYGFPRGLMTFLDMGLLLIAPWMLRADAVEAGYVIIALSVTQVLTAAINPVGQVALVVSARYQGAKNTKAIREGVALLAGAIVSISLLITAFLVPWNETLVALWLGDAVLARGVSAQVSFLLWGTLPLAVFCGLKGIVEACWVQPLNLYSLVVGYAVFFFLDALLSARIGDANSAGLSLVGAFWAIGIATLIWLRHYLPPLRYFGFTRLGAMLVAVAGIAYGTSAFGGLLALVSALVLCSATVVLAARVLPTPFTEDCQRLLWPSTKSK